MAGPKKLSPRVVRNIFESTDSAPSVAKRHKVSANLVYLIRDRRIHKAVTDGLTAPRRAARRTQQTKLRGARLDLNRLADLISKRVVSEFVKRLRTKS